MELRASLFLQKAGCQEHNTNEKLSTSKVQNQKVGARLQSIYAFL